MFIHICEFKAKLYQAKIHANTMYITHLHICMYILRYVYITAYKTYKYMIMSVR